MSQKTHEQVAAQCRVVAALALAISDIHADLARIHEAKEPLATELIESRGARSAELMEILGDILNGMDANAPDYWMAPVFERAHQLWGRS